MILNDQKNLSFKIQHLKILMTDLPRTRVDQTPQEKNHPLVSFTILPETSDSMSLNNFIASITQRTSPLLIVLPTSTKRGLSGAGFL